MLRLIKPWQGLKIQDTVGDSFRVDVACSTHPQEQLGLIIPIRFEVTVVFVSRMEKERRLEAPTSKFRRYVLRTYLPMYIPYLSKVLGTIII